jgi:hypothetical protein
MRLHCPWVGSSGLCRLAAMLQFSLAATVVVALYSNGWILAAPEAPQGEKPTLYDSWARVKPGSSIIWKMEHSWGPPTIYTYTLVEVTAEKVVVKADIVNGPPFRDNLEFKKGVPYPIFEKKAGEKTTEETVTVDGKKYVT